LQEDAREPSPRLPLFQKRTSLERLVLAFSAPVGEGQESEVCGLWVWVGGETRQHKDALKAAGYHWAIKKLRWYFAGVPADGFRPFDMEEIRQRYGSQRVMTRSAYPMEEANA
jgi:hypothetical protein